MENHWHDIWNNRKINAEALESGDSQKIVLELKRLVGWDCQDKLGGYSGEAMYRELVKEYHYIKENLQPPPCGSVFEVGCGSGANLYFFRNDGFQVGGSDFAANLVAVAERVIGRENMIECFASEAIDLPVDIKYDAVFSGGVFQYFNDFDYAERVLDRMLEKTKYSIGILRIHDADKEDAFYAFRRAKDKDYDKNYEGLPKLFFPEDFFKQYATKHKLEVKFDRRHIEGCWNDPFNFNCFMYKVV